MDGAVVSTDPVVPVFSWYLGQPIPFYAGGMTDWPVDHYEISVSEKTSANCDPQVVLAVTGVTTATTAAGFEVTGTVTNNTAHVVLVAVVEPSM